MNGVLIVKCKGCGSLKSLYLSDDNNVDNEESDKHIAELRDKVEKESGTSNTTFLDTRGLNYFICSCGNYSSIQEIKDTLNFKKVAQIRYYKNLDRVLFNLNLGR